MKRLALVACPDCIDKRGISSIAAVVMENISDENQHTVKCDIHGEVDSLVFGILPMPGVSLV